MISFKDKRVISVLLMTVLIIVMWITVNKLGRIKRVIIDDVPEIIFSRESGFYDKDFDLEISAPKGEIYYTLDGSDPTISSFHYEGPIHIQDATNNPNVYSMRTDVSTDFCKDLGIDTFYKVPDFPVDKCTIVRAVLYYGDDRYSDIKTASYFVGYEGREAYDGMNIISIVTDPYNLFDYNEGCYVRGAVFDNFLASTEDIYSVPYWMWVCNYSKGMVSEKKISIQVFDPEKKLVLSQACGMRIRGGASRSKNPKSLNFYAREEYDGNKNFMLDFWHNGLFPSRATLFQGGDDDKAKGKDYVFHTLCKDMNFATMDYEPYVMFLDGEYWGVYWLTEKYGKDYIHNHYDVDKDNIIIVKNNMVTEGEPEEMDLYLEMVDYCTGNDLSIEENYDYLFDKYLDHDSTIDYYAALLYVARCADWPGWNYSLWRSRTVANDKYSDGKWRWLAFDLNSGGLTPNLIDHDSIDAATKDEMFASLLKSPKFRKELTDRMLELKDTTFSKESVRNCISDARSILDTPMIYHCKRFWGEGSTHFYNDSMDDLLLFLEKRNDSIGDIIEKYR